jgi:hypothetical protein
VCSLLALGCAASAQQPGMSFFITSYCFAAR